MMDGQDFLLVCRMLHRFVLLFKYSQVRAAYNLLQSAVQKLQDPHFKEEIGDKVKETAATGWNLVSGFVMKVRNLNSLSK